MRTPLQKRLLLDIETSFNVLCESFYGNYRELNALNKIRDALVVLNDPDVVNKDNPPEEQLLIERLFQTTGNIKDVAVYAIESVSDNELYDTLINLCSALTNSKINEELDTKGKKAIDRYRKSLLGDYAPGRKIIPFPSENVPELDN